MSVAKARLFIIIGILASLTVGIGEYLLHYSPAGISGEISMLYNVELSRARLGHYLVVFGAPLYFVGYFGLRQLFIKTDRFLANLIFILGILSFSIGGVWVSSRYFAAVVFQKSMATNDFEYFLSQYESAYQVLVWVLRILVLTISVCYALLIHRNKLGLPKWLSILNPVFILGFIISTLFWFPLLGNHIAPTAMNVTHFIFFSTLLFSIRQRSLS